MTTAIYDKSLSLDQIVYLVSDGEIVSAPIRDLDGFIDETTSPLGIRPRIHARGNELWTWGHCGNSPTCLVSFDSPDEAVTAEERCHAHDFWNSQNILAFASRQEAVDFIESEERNKS